MEGEGWVRGWGLEICNELTDLLFIVADGKYSGGQKMCFFCERHDCMATKIKITSIKRNVLSVSFVAFLTINTYAKD